MFTDTITIYNRFKADGKERWQRKVVKGVSWIDTQGTTTRKTGMTPANTFTLLIPKRCLEGYVEPRAFTALADKDGKWTVAPQDTVALGEVAVEITTTPGKDLEALDHVRTVTMVDTLLRGRLAHLEVTGK